MELLIVRHAIAVEPQEWTGPDDERPLTGKGRSRMKQNAAGLVIALPHLEVIASSPYARAAQTAVILRAAYGAVEIEELPPLASGGSRQDILGWLVARKEKRIALVGHEPDLGLLVAWLLTGQTNAAIEMRKGGACLLEFRGHPASGAATLRWLATPWLLRRIGG